jgi:hypothetical protein
VSGLRIKIAPRMNAGFHPNSVIRRSHVNPFLQGRGKCCAR